jgi:hypothetical protein
MRTVFQPLNLKMEKAIIDNSQLLVGDTVPPIFRALIAHTEAYKAVIATWRPDDLSACQQSPSQTQRPCAAVSVLKNTAGINFPDAVVQCAAEDYEKLKQRQQELESGFFSAFFAQSVQHSHACDYIQTEPQMP